MTTPVIYHILNPLLETPDGERAVCTMNRRSMLPRLATDFQPHAAGQKVRAALVAWNLGRRHERKFRTGADPGEVGGQSF